MEQLNANVQQAIQHAETLCRILQTETLPPSIRVRVVKANLEELNASLEGIGLSTLNPTTYLNDTRLVTDLYTALRSTTDVLYKLDASLNQSNEPNCAPILALLADLQRNTGLNEYKLVIREDGSGMIYNLNGHALFAFDTAIELYSVGKEQ